MPVIAPAPRAESGACAAGAPAHPAAAPGGAGRLSGRGPGPGRRRAPAPRAARAPASPARPRPAPPPGPPGPAAGPAAARGGEGFRPPRIGGCGAPGGGGRRPGDRRRGKAVRRGPSRVRAARPPGGRENAFADPDLRPGAGAAGRGIGAAVRRGALPRAGRAPAGRQRRPRRSGSSRGAGAARPPPSRVWGHAPASRRRENNFADPDPRLKGGGGGCRPRALPGP